MRFELFPILDRMLYFYGKPLNPQRFYDYLEIMQGGTKDLLVPIANFNPMAKDHVLEKLLELQKLDIEKVIQQELTLINKEIKNRKESSVFKVAFNLADDLKGGWTNRYSTDYDNKYKLNALVSRNFCVTLLWSSEEYSIEKIKSRIRETCHRTICWLDHPKPKTLEDHINLERIIALKAKLNEPASDIDVQQMDAFYNENKATDNYTILLNFLYGDQASIHLGLAPVGIKEDMAGFKYARLQ